MTGGGGVARSAKKTDGAFPPERSAFTISEFCARNGLSKPTFYRMRADGRGPVEMRISMNVSRVSADEERAWQRRMQEPRPDIETRAIERAVKAGSAAVKSTRHVSKKRWAR
jgi:predicted DNA-binding transcriptional regulator AlpA